MGSTGVSRRAVLVEMGNAGVAGMPAPAIASYGATLANANARC